MLARLKRLRGELMVFVTDDGSASSENATPTRVGKVWIDPNVRAVLPTAWGPKPISLEEGLGHEFGHAILGEKDDGPGMMNNVHRNENPIRRDLARPPRSGYTTWDQ